MSNIKRGSTFSATVLFTENEWAGIFPWDDAMAFISQESNRIELDVNIDEDNMILEITGDTSDWSIGPAKFDLWIIKDEKTIPIPNGYNIEIMVIQGGLS